MRRASKTSRSGSTVLRSVGLLVVLFLSAGCALGGGAQSGTKAAARTTVDELAQGVPGAVNEGRLSTRLKALNGGDATVPPGVAQDFESGDGVVKQIIDGTEPGWGYACDAWERRQPTVQPGAPANSQNLLATMQQQINDQTVLEQSIQWACVINKIKDSAQGG